MLHFQGPLVLQMTPAEKARQFGKLVAQREYLAARLRSLKAQQRNREAAVVQAELNQTVNKMMRWNSK